MLRRFWLSFAILAVSVALCDSSSADQRPNVLFISVDDLNDWVSLFGGHPQARTPNIDRLASRGAVVFQNAHCPGPVCGPSRSALLSGFMPHRSGVYTNSQNMLRSSLVQAHATLPEYFAKHGYLTISRGKIFHAHATENGLDRGQWAFERWEQGRGSAKVDPAKVTSRSKNMINGQPGPPTNMTKRSGSEFAWGPTIGGIEDTGDFQTAKWAAKELAMEHDRPFFMAVGFSKPHLPFFAPQEFFDMYPLSDLKSNPILEDDLDDILKPDGQLKFAQTTDFSWVQENDLFDEATQAYLACVSFADACVGEVLDALESSPYADNTIVVLWGDHGWHLGEKLRYRKATGWFESTRLPLVIRTPNMNQRQDCPRPVNLIDLYPTLIEYCGLPAKPEIDGTSLLPLLEDPTREWAQATVTIVRWASAAVHSERWHYILHVDGTRELYDADIDKLEWNNLANSPTAEQKEAMVQMSKFLPKKYAREIPKSDPTWKTSAKGLDRTLKAKRNLSELQ
ncbi:MAG: sulfatase [Pirellulaceae bacterium]|nr:sulfatase [Pirellulaceae bacterium]